MGSLRVTEPVEMAIREENNHESKLLKHFNNKITIFTVFLVWPVFTVFFFLPFLPVKRIIL